MDRWKILLIVAMTFLLICTTAYGKEASSVSDDWRFEFTAYFFAPDVDVVSTVNGMETPVALSFGDVLEHFDLFGLSGRVEAWWKNKWVLILDAMYVDVEKEAELMPPAPMRLNIDVDVDIEELVIDLLLGYRIADLALRKGHQKPSIFFDVMAGGRYHYYKQEIKLVVMHAENKVLAYILKD